MAPWRGPHYYFNVNPILHVINPAPGVPLGIYHSLNNKPRSTKKGDRSLLSFIYGYGRYLNSDLTTWLIIDDTSFGKRPKSQTAFE